MKKLFSLFLAIAMVAGVYAQGPGDVCSTAITAVLGNNTVGTLTYPSAFDGGAENAKWYKFTPTVSGVYVAKTCGQGVDTRGWVLTGTCTNYTIVAEGDDECELAPGDDTFATEMVWQATAGTTYYIVWDDAYANDGFVFDLSQSPFSFVNVKFQVDASQITVGAAGMYIGITAEDDLLPMTAEGNGIYSYTYTVLGGNTVKYIFINGEGGFETPPANCAPYDSNFELALRTYTVPNGNSIVPVVCFNQCTACGSQVQTYAVTLTVDMAFNELMGNVTSPNGVHVAGSFQSLIGATGDWQPGETPLTNIPGTTKYTRTVQLPDGNYEFKFLNGNDWGTDESVTDTVCGGAGGFGNNRFLEVNGGNVNIDVCFRYCVDCATVITETDDQALAAAVAVRPNPATSSTWLDVNFAQPTDINVHIVNSLGQTVYTATLTGISSQSTELNLSHIPAGVYQVVIRSDVSQTIRQLVVQK
jgi:hypothetical protein